MREILFRGKLAYNGVWVYGGFYKEPVDDIKDGKTYIITGSLSFAGNANQVIPETIGQFTGLTDKNGQKIFEGDMVHIDNYDEGWDSVVEFNGGAFAVDVEGRDYDYTAIGWTEYRSIIIGNIHDNPDLLT